MTTTIKRTASLALIMLMLTGSVAQASVLAPPPPPREGKAPTSGCYTPNQVAARIVGNVKDAGYLDTFRWVDVDGGKKKQAFGVKERDQWYAFIVEMCKGGITIEQKLKYGRPGFI